MSCCGNKRREWQRGAATEASAAQGSADQAPVETHAHPGRIPADERKPLLFECVASAPLTLKGVHSGNLYRFRFPGDRVTVPYEDTFAMMAERGVRVVG
jgi:hypothetical protein